MTEAQSAEVYPNYIFEERIFFFIKIYKNIQINI